MEATRLSLPPAFMCTMVGLSTRLRSLRTLNGAIVRSILDESPAAIAAFFTACSAAAFSFSVAVTGRESRAVVACKGNPCFADRGPGEGC